MEMKTFVTLKKLVILFAITIIMVSCSETNKTSRISMIKDRVDSLEKVYAPDARIVLWNVFVKNENGEIDIVGQVAGKKAWLDLQKLKSLASNLKIKVLLLPEHYVGFTHFALINNSVATMRVAASNKAEIVSQSLLGTPVKVYKKEDGWDLVQTPNQYLGWMTESSLVLLDSVNLKAYKAEKKIVFHRQYGFSYSKPDTKSQVVSDLVIGDILPVIGSEKSFYQVQYPDKRIAFVKKDKTIGFTTFFNKEPKQNELVETAKKFVGIPYLWGGMSSKAIDCSGFTSMIYLMNGVVLLRDASEQALHGKVITTDFVSSGLKPGDLMYFGRKATGSLPEKVVHAAMYIGDGNIIQSSGKVRITSMDSTQPNYDRWDEQHFLKAVRIIGHENGKTIQKVSENKFYQIIK